MAVIFQIQVMGHFDREFNDQSKIKVIFGLIVQFLLEIKISKLWPQCMKPPIGWGWKH